MPLDYNIIISIIILYSLPDVTARRRRVIRACVCTVFSRQVSSIIPLIPPHPNSTPLFFYCLYIIIIIIIITHVVTAITVAAVTYPTLITVPTSMRVWHMYFLRKNNNKHMRIILTYRVFFFFTHWTIYSFSSCQLLCIRNSILFFFFGGGWRKKFVVLNKNSKIITTLTIVYIYNTHNAILKIPVVFNTNTNIIPLKCF